MPDVLHVHDGTEWVPLREMLGVDDLADALDALAEAVRALTDAIRRCDPAVLNAAADALPDTDQETP